MSSDNRKQAGKFDFGPGTVLGQCAYCVHLAPAGSLAVAASCKAFPSAIPPAILANEADHRVAFEGDGGVRFTPRDDVPGTTLGRLAAVLDAL